MEAVLEERREDAASGGDIDASADELAAERLLAKRARSMDRLGTSVRGGNGRTRSLPGTDSTPTWQRGLPVGSPPPPICGMSEWRRPQAGSAKQVVASSARELRMVWNVGT